MLWLVQYAVTSSLRRASTSLWPAAASRQNSAASTILGDLSATDMLCHTVVHDVLTCSLSESKQANGNHGKAWHSMFLTWHSIALPHMARHSMAQYGAAWHSPDSAGPAWIKQGLAMRSRTLQGSAPAGHSVLWHGMALQRPSMHSIRRQVSIVLVVCWPPGH